MDDYNKWMIICSYEATSSRKTRSLVQELTTGAVASIFLVCIFVQSLCRKTGMI